MPVLSFEGPKLTKEQKEKLIKEMTDAAARVVPDIPKRAYYFFVREYDDENMDVVAGYWRERSESLIPAILAHVFANVGGSLISLVFR